MNLLAESAFVSALKNLASTLAQREDEGLTQFIDPDQIGQLHDIAEGMDEKNIHEMLSRLVVILENFGEIRGRAIRDNAGSHRSIAFHLTCMYFNSIGGEDDVQKVLDIQLAEKMELFDYKAKALERYARC